MWRITLKTYKQVTKKVEDKTFCDICGSCCTDDNCGDEYATLEALWGYVSKKDGSKYDIQICERCFDETLEWMRQKRKFYLGSLNYPYNTDPLKNNKYTPYRSSPQINTYEAETTNTQEPS